MLADLAVFLALLCAFNVAVVCALSARGPR